MNLCQLVSMRRDIVFIYVRSLNERTLLNTLI